LVLSATVLQFAMAAETNRHAIHCEPRHRSRTTFFITLPSPRHDPKSLIPVDDALFLMINICGLPASAKWRYDLQHSLEQRRRQPVAEAQRTRSAAAATGSKGMAAEMQRDAEHARMPAPRRLVCAGCGTAFDCTLGGECWCSAEPYRLPMPEGGGSDCLCPTCLRAAAARQGVGQNGSR
jgi:hypothetical protein